MRTFLIACLFLLSAPLLAQDTSYTTTKEKIYVHTSHVFFKPGETIFFKLYVVKAKDQTPSWQSPTVYAELINPAGNVMQKAKYPVTAGYAEGSFDFDAEASGGIYKIRAYTTWMRNEGDSSFFTKEITVQKVITPRILMKLDFPQKGYGAGNAVTADFSMRNLSDEPIRFYTADFSVSIGGARVQSGTIKTDREGKAQVRFTLPQELKTSDGLLNLTVNYDSYTEAISRSIPIVLNHIDFQLMPEGGSLVQGLSSWIAFRAVNEQGKPVDIRGEVVDDGGHTVATLESYHGGMGKFAFTPQAGGNYRVRITSPSNIAETFALPAAAPAGAVLHVSKTGGRVAVQVTATQEMAVRLVTEMKGQVYDQRTVLLHAGQNSFEVNESLFPAGIARFTLYTPDQLPVAERLFFMNEGRNLQVRISTDKSRYLPREPVKLQIQTLDANGKPVPANLSLSVMDDQLWTFADDKQDHILSWLLMSSELHGRIDEPQFYFKKDEPKAAPALDLVMLTHGYRYFDYVAGAGPGRLKFMPEQEQMVSGLIHNVSGRPLRARVLLITPGANSRVLQAMTDTSGLFFFSGLSAGTDYYLLTQAQSRRESAFIDILQKDIGYNPLQGRDPGHVHAVRDNTAGVIKPGKNVVNRRAAKAAAAPVQELREMGNALQEVVVVGYGVTRKKDISGAIAVIRANDLGAINHVAGALQGQVAGLVVTQQAGNPLDKANVMIRGSGSIGGGAQPLVVVDGVPMERFNLNTLNAQDIDNIAVLKNASALAIYGSQAANGVIVIESKKYRSERISIRLSRALNYSVQQVRLDGASFTAVRRFYAPKYTEVDVDDKQDFRPTIYWNPVVQTDREGKAELTYCNSDASTTFRIVAEGIGYQGLVGRNEKTYSVKNALGVDAKIPPYLTVGDRALLPLVIRNNRDQSVHLSISIVVPQNMKVGNYPSVIDVPADSSRQLLIPVEATGAVKGDIQFIVEGDGRRQKVSLPISAAEKGFPVVITCSGNHSATHDFSISQPVPGSMRPHTKLFKSLEGQLLDGIESMLREPYGCFEQTSSSTYPNIYVLKYLRESGRSNPEIEKKALQYITAGYKRLVGFETAKNGFEWFGHAPAHEALTAYGLLEFTDMKEFVDVDPAMMKRTKEFLMSRRDGTGSFTLASGGYDRFASVPNKIANIYIVYALTQAGIGREIEREYKTAVQKAMASKDAYQLAMMALAANNMGNMNDYKQLMTELDRQYKKEGLTAETSVVNSRDISLKVESSALYALALMRDPSPRIVDVAALISDILSSKSYYGYGSTQATVLALQAIVNYSKLIGRLSDNLDIEFMVNGQQVQDDSVMLALLREGNNKYSVRYGSSSSAIPYSFELAYNTLVPPNSARAELQLSTVLATKTARVGETVRMDVSVHNEKSSLQPMAVAKIGIPAGLSVQPWQLKEIAEKNEVAYYEIFDNYLVFYWMGFAPSETKTVHLDLKAEIEGSYKAKASNVYLYYTPEHKHWNAGVDVTVAGAQ